MTCQWLRNLNEKVILLPFPVNDRLLLWCNVSSTVTYDSTYKQNIFCGFYYSIINGNPYYSSVTVTFTQNELTDRLLSKLSSLRGARNIEREVLLGTKQRSNARTFLCFFISVLFFATFVHFVLHCISTTSMQPVCSTRSTLQFIFLNVWNIILNKYKTFTKVNILLLKFHNHKKLTIASWDSFFLDFYMCGVSWKKTGMVCAKKIKNFINIINLLSLILKL